jgi:lipopolysaccharide/colanic/teichoic acid biosynthesis glycosyltransferase
MELIIVNQPRVNPRRQEYQYVKRLFDIGLCLISLPIVIPAMLFCALAIFIDSGRPIFFTQQRIGKGGKPILIYKLRTLRMDLDNRHHHSFMKAFVRGEMGKGEEAKETFKPVTDNQITRVGRFLRKTSLDEIPQLINVLKGEMSIVGPRPNVPWEVEEYRPWHCERLEVLPGITGLAQVRGRSAIGFDSIVRYDINYIENQSLELDIKILWWTFTSVIISKGAG